MRNLGALAFALVWLTLGCGDDGSNPPPPPGPDAWTGLQPPPPAGGQQLASDPYTIPHGQEKYFCYTFHSPANEVSITRVEPIQSAHVHHVVLFQVMPSMPEPEGFFECPQLIRLNWQPIWAGGAGVDALDLPEGVGFDITPNTQYLIQYHLQNLDDTDVTEQAGINLTYQDPAGLEKAGIYALGSFAIDIPPQAMDFQKVVSCNADRDLHIFAAFPHMHKIGKSITFETGTSETDAQLTYEKDPWIFGDQPMEPVDFDITNGEFLRATCTWDNPSMNEIMFGESSENEMCFMVFFGYPFTDLAGCIQS